MCSPPDVVIPTSTIYHTRGEHTGQYTTDVGIPTSTMYHTRGEHTGQYTTDVVIPTSTIYIVDVGITTSVVYWPVCSPLV
jgi:hypothetical protein